MCETCPDHSNKCSLWVGWAQRQADVDENIAALLDTRRQQRTPEQTPPKWPPCSLDLITIGPLACSHLGEVPAPPSMGPPLAPVGRSHPVLKAEALVNGGKTEGLVFCLVTGPALAPGVRREWTRRAPASSRGDFPLPERQATDLLWRWSKRQYQDPNLKGTHFQHVLAQPGHTLELSRTLGPAMGSACLTQGDQVTAGLQSHLTVYSILWARSSCPHSSHVKVTATSLKLTGG